MPKFEFELSVTGVTLPVGVVMDRLKSAGCGDATIRRLRDELFLTFKRDAETYNRAVLSAVHDVKKAEVGHLSHHVRRALLATNNGDDETC